MLLAMSSEHKKRDLYALCGSGPCDPEHEDAVDSYESTRTAFRISVSVCILGLGAAGALLFTLPKEEPDTALSAWVGLGSAGVAGSF